MKKLNGIKDELNAEVTPEQLEKLIYNLFAAIVIFMPIMPEIRNFGIVSLKWTVFVLLTVITSVALIALEIKVKKVNKLTGIDFILIIYLILVAISTLLTNHGIIKAILGTNGRGEGLLLIACYSVTFAIFSKGYKHLRWALKASIIAACIVGIYSCLQALLPIDITLPFELKRIENVATGTMLNQNFFSSYICMFLPMMSFCYINTGNKISLLLVILLFLAQVFSVTLGGYSTFIGMYVLIVIYSLVCNKQKKKILINTFILTTVIVLSFITVDNINDNKYKKELFGLKKETYKLIKKDEKFATNRLGIWKKTVMVIDNYKWFGVGPDSLRYEIYKDEYLLSWPRDGYSHRIIDKAHCEVLQIAATTGIPSAIVYLVFVGTICILLLKFALRGIRNNSTDKMNNRTLYIHMILISILSYFVQSMGNISVVQVAPIFWTILGLGAGTIYQEKANSYKCIN